MTASHLSDSSAPSPTLRVEDIRHSHDRDAARASARLSIGSTQHDVWFRVSRAPIASRADAWLCATLIPAMKLGAALQIDGAVGPRLLASSSSVQDIMAMWSPRCRRVSIRADRSDVEPRTAPRPAACFFSGGVDSFYTLLKHRDAIDTLIFVHGHDTPLDERDRLAAISQRIHAAARELGKSAIDVETNLRDFSERYATWAPEYFGSFLGSIAALLAPQFATIYIPASCDYNQLDPFGSHPLLDPLWSTDEMTIVHDGCEATRFQRVARIAASDVALRYLRVCLRDRGPIENCARCEKCLRTMVSLRILGALDHCRTFAHPLDLARVARVDTSSDETRSYVEENLRALRDVGAANDPLLEQALQDALGGLYRRGVWGWPVRAARLAGRALRRQGRSAPRAESSRAVVSEASS